MKFLAALMIAVGALMTTLCGLCTLAFTSGEAMRGVAVTIGTPFIVFGLMLVAGGVVLWRQPPRD